MISPQSEIRTSVSSSTTIATSFGAGRNGGENGPRADNGHELLEALSDRLAAMTEAQYQGVRDDEAYKRRTTKGALDKLRADGLKRAKEQARAKANSDGAEQQKRRLTDDDTGKLRAECEALADLEGVTLNHRVNELAERWAEWDVTAADIKAEIRSILKRRDEETGSKSGGLEVTFSDPEPWEIPVDGALLLDEIAATIQHNMDLPEHVAELCALWIAHTYCYKLFDHSIRLAIMSPEPRCGKTRLQDLLALMVWRPKQSANMSPAVMFRLVAHYGVTLIIDEVDTHLAGPNANPETRGILNAGHGRNGCVDRCEGDDNKVVSFQCFGPVVLGGIGGLPATLADRSALIWLERKSKGIKLDRIKTRAENWPRIRRQLMRWADDNFDSLAAAEPKIPDALTDRQADGWFALLSIADVAGSDWSAKGEAAAIAISGAAPDTETTGAQLLADIFELFHDNKAPPEEAPKWEPKRARDSSGDYVPKALASKDIVEALNRLIDRPWPEWRGKGLTSAGLSRLLRKFRVSSRQLGGKPGIDGNPHGYEYEQFLPVWARYLDSNRYNAKTRGNPPKTAKIKPLETGAHSVSDFPANPQKSAVSSVIAVSNGGFEPDDAGLPEQRPGDDAEMEVAL